MPRPTAIDIKCGNLVHTEPRQLVRGGYHGSQHHPGALDWAQGHQQQLLLNQALGQQQVLQQIYLPHSIISLLPALLIALLVCASFATTGDPAGDRDAPAKGASGRLEGRACRSTTTTSLQQLQHLVHHMGQLPMLTWTASS